MYNIWNTNRPTDLTSLKQTIYRIRYEFDIYSIIAFCIKSLTYSITHFQWVNLNFQFILIIQFVCMFVKYEILFDCRFHPVLHILYVWFLIVFDYFFPLYRIHVLGTPCAALFHRFSTVTKCVRWHYKYNGLLSHIAAPMVPAMN